MFHATCYMKYMSTPARSEKILDVVSQRQAGLTIVLEDIHDPHNAAAICRSAEAFGVQDIHVIFVQEKYVNLGRVGKTSSSSANQWLTFHYYTSTEECLATLKEKGFEVVATALTDTAEDIFEAELASPNIALMIGNEHRGLSDRALKIVDRVIQIPMRGFVQSLNVSVTAAIGLFEITRQRLARKVLLPLSSAEQEALVAEFSPKSV